MIGLLPCAGKAERIHGLPKYLLPVPGGYLLDWHVQSMKKAKCREVRLESNKDNLKLLHQFAPDAVVWVAEHDDTMAQTVLSAYEDMKVSDCEDETVIFGMPDTYWTDRNGQSVNIYDLFVRFHSPADVVMMCCQVRHNQWKQGGMVTIDPHKPNGNVVKITDKPEQTETPWIWGALMWRPSFLSYLHPEDPHIGYGVQRAVEAGLYVHAIMPGDYDDTEFWDCGTPERYFEMIRVVTGQAARS